MNIKFKNASKNDQDILFKWTNDVDVRANAFNKDIINYANHVIWFDNKLNSLNTYIYICYLDEVPVGQIRVDIEKSIGTIGYSIDRNYRGLGLGTYILKHIDRVLDKQNIKINKLVGKVLCTNIYSKNAFLKAGFKEIKKREYIEYFKCV